MSIITAFPGIKRSVVYPFCFLPFLGALFYEIDHHIFRHVEFVSIWWPCLVVFMLHAMMLVFQASCSQISCDFFHLSDKNPKKACVVSGGGGIFSPVTRHMRQAFRWKASPKQVVSSQSVKSNAISVVWEQPKMLLPMLSLIFFISRKFQYQGNPC